MSDVTVTVKTTVRRFMDIGGKQVVVGADSGGVWIGLPDEFLRLSADALPVFIAALQAAAAEAEGQG